MNDLPWTNQKTLLQAGDWTKLTLQNLVARGFLDFMILPENG